MSARNNKTLLVFLHGSGDTGPNLRSYLDTIPLKKYNYQSFNEIVRNNNVDILTPTAPYQSYLPMGGEMANVWYNRSADFTNLGMDDIEDIKNIDASVKLVLDAISNAINNNNYNRVIVGGFSMGGGLALHLLRSNNIHNDIIKGIFSIGSYLVHDSIINTAVLGSCSALPVIMMHGADDNLINHDWGKATATNLLLRNIDIQFRSYSDVDHEIAEEQLEELIDWIKDIFSTQNDDSKDNKTCDNKHYYDSKYCDNNEVTIAESKLESLSVGASVETRDSALHDYAAKAKDEISAMANRQRDITNNVNSNASIVQSSYSAGATAATIDNNSHSSSEGERSDMKIPYTIQYLNTKDFSPTKFSGIPRIEIKFQIPSKYVNALTSRPVLACGSMFEIVPDPPNGVKTIFNSSDPHKTAYEIGRRLQFRLTSGSSSLNPCAMN